MITARGKKKENIAEYILYMWHIEDQIRAFSFDIDKIQAGIINNYDLPDDTKYEIRDWYESLIEMMRSEGVTEKGHLQINKNAVQDLTDLHKSLLSNPAESYYIMTYYKVLPLIVELRSKNTNQETEEIESCLNLMYGILLLRLKREKISEETLNATGKIAEFLRLLASKYKKDKEEGIEL